MQAASEHQTGAGTRSSKIVSTAYKISVITIVYNDRAGFALTAASVVSQIDADWEWIVIDGGSKDGTVELIARYADHMAYHCSEPDRGIFDAMNKGLDKVSGDFLVFMNSGDRFAQENTLSLVSQTIMRAKPGVGMVLGGARFELSPTYSYVQMPRPLDPYVRHSLPTSHQAMFFRAELHRKVTFDLKLRIAADYEAICRMYIMNSDAAYVPEVVAVVWRGLESNSMRSPFENFRDMASTQRRVLRLGRAEVMASMIRRALPVIAFRLMSYRWSKAITTRLVTAMRPEISSPGRG